MVIFGVCVNSHWIQRMIEPTIYKCTTRGVKRDNHHINNAIHYTSLGMEVYKILILKLFPIFKVNTENIIIKLRKELVLHLSYLAVMDQ